MFQTDVRACAKAQRWEWALCAQNQSEQGEEREELKLRRQSFGV